MTSDKSAEPGALDKLKQLAEKRHQDARILQVFVIGNFDNVDEPTGYTVARSIAEALAAPEDPRTYDENLDRGDVMIASLPPLNQDTMEEWKRLERKTVSARAMEWDVVIHSEDVSARAYRSVDVVVDAKSGRFDKMYTVKSDIEGNVRLVEVPGDVR